LHSQLRRQRQMCIRDSPTQEGPTMMFNNVKGFPETRVLIGIIASRDRVGKILHHDPKHLGRLLKAVSYTHLTLPTKLAV
ncbi:UbiD family decarboxylase, partial [Enterococcus sp. S181_ASV_20]|nr:UbiD family decarboxylase [Enterococcus sp. S181_ASV_20]